MPEPEADRERTLEAARTIRPYLETLRGVEDPAAVDAELVTALAASDAERALAALRGQTATRRWLNDFRLHGVPSDLLPADVRSGAAPPGLGEVVRAPRYRCAANDYVWYRRSPGVAIPVCPTHGMRLEPDRRAGA